MIAEADQFGALSEQVESAAVVGDVARGDDAQRIGDAGAGRAKVGGRAADGGRPDLLGAGARVGRDAVEGADVVKAVLVGAVGVEGSAVVSVGGDKKGDIKAASRLGGRGRRLRQECR